ncbi:MAG: HEPN domain-containing protein [Candidatus Omnitrophica bacterium]|nr:HEPN domain-containing protein [Candidatus Omnitrophota bacterium]
MSSARRYKTKVINRSDYEIFLKKAKEFYQTMYQAEKAENWNAAGLNGVHCVISLIDALLIRHAGMRSIEEDHMAVVDLINSNLSNKIQGIDKKTQTARRVIAKKNLVAYENRNFLKLEALELIKHVQRFYDWSTKQI